MELLFVILLGATLGFSAQGLLRTGSDTYGTLLPGTMAAAVTAVVWAALLWAGLGVDNLWLWLASVTAGTLASVVIAVALPKRRIAADAALLEKLSGTAKP